MKSRNRMAFKEWAVVCEALEKGVQSLILRKGGIQEGADGFRVEHREFWLFPTGFHQQPEELSPAGQPLLERVKSVTPTPGMVPVRDYVVVKQVIEIQNESLLPKLSSLHIWSESTLKDRFHYRTPMLFGLVVRVYRRRAPLYIPELSQFAGCKSWVDFPIEIETAELEPVLSDEEHNRHVQRIHDAITGA